MKTKNSILIAVGLTVQLACNPEVKEQEIIQEDEKIEQSVAKTQSTCYLPDRTYSYKEQKSLRMPNLGDTIIWVKDTGQYISLASYAKLNDHTGKERFMMFMYHFAYNPFFQKRRTKFPLSISVLDHRQETQVSYDLESNSMKRKLFQNFTGLHWLPYKKSWISNEKDSCVNFVTIDKDYIANYYFTLDSIWHLSEVHVDYPNGTINENMHGQELFDDFLWNFISDSAFSISRIQFPFLFYSTDIVIDSTTITKTEKDDWNPYQFGYGNPKYNYQYYGIYYNHEKSYPKSDTMDVRYAFNDNGIAFGFQFVSKGGRWFLISGEDHSN